MNNLGIVAEYNPFHNGHLHHLVQSKNALKSNYTICIMSGNFIQRGLPALYDKWIRTKMAIQSGIDLVIELPIYYSVNSAEFFADYSIKLLDSLNCINTISFGTECNNIELLSNISNVLLSEPKEYKEELKNQLTKGITFAKANEISLLKILNSKKYSDILKSPNNILGIEYIKALKKHNSSIVPYTIKRNTDYLDKNISNNICSATAIRELLHDNKINRKSLSKLVPNATYELINSSNCTFLEKFGTQILYSIRKMELSTLCNILEVTEGLESRLKKYSFETNNIYEFIDLVKTKRFTQAKIQRILIHILLDMTKSEFNDIQKNGYMYIRILGFNSNGKEIIKKLSKKCNIPIITSVKKYVEQYGNNPLLKKDMLSSDIYCQKYNIDFTQKIIEY